jgi:hypothetical protein
MGRQRPAVNFANFWRARRSFFYLKKLADLRSLGDYTGEIGHQFQMKSAIDSGGNKAS